MKKILICFGIVMLLCITMVSAMRVESPKYQYRSMLRLPIGVINVSKISIPIQLADYPEYGHFALAQMGQERRNKGRIDNANSITHYTIRELNQKRTLR